MTRIYDNSNLAESYAGVVTPLTASFARDLYDGVYRHFTAFMGVSATDRRAHEAMFGRMIVTIGYHLYYDIRNWYTLVSLLPGYRYNKAFFEQMLGIPPGAHTEQVPVQERALGRMVARARLFLQIGRIGVVLLEMPLLVWLFNRRFDRAFGAFTRMDLAAMSYDELCTHYQDVRRTLVRLWRVPIANDFAVMVSTGIARTLYGAWAPGNDFALQLRLASKTQLAALDPGRLLISIVKSINAHPQLAVLFAGPAVAVDVYRTLCTDYADTEVFQLIQAYIARYGSRVPNELKLEAPTLHESPEKIVGMLRALSAAPGNLYRSRVGSVVADTNVPIQGRFRRMVLAVVLSWARRSIRYREETRLRRTQIFGHARQVFLTIGERLVQAGVLAERVDVLFLTAEEMCMTSTVPFREKVDARKQEFARWRDITMPTRIESDDSMADIECRILSEQKAPTPTAESIVVKGMVASRAQASILQGEALVLKEFNGEADFHDKVLITRHTDPGWTVIFPFVRAIVVERGGILSHASIVAREMNIPCIIGAVGATDCIPQGAAVSLDLHAGTVTVRAH